MPPAPNELATAAYQLGIVTGRREICEGVVKKLRSRLDGWRLSVAKRPGWLGLLMAGMVEPLVVELERLIAMSEAELVGLATEHQRLTAAYEQQLARAAEQPRPLAKARQRATS